MKIPHLFGRIALAASMLLGSLAAQATEFRSSDIHPEDYPTVLAVRHMGETLSKATGGKHSIKVYAKGSLGIEKDTIEQTKLGAIAMTRVNVAPMNNIEDPGRKTAARGQLGQRHQSRRCGRIGSQYDRGACCQNRRSQTQRLEHCHPRADRNRDNCHAIVQPGLSNLAQERQCHLHLSAGFSR